MEQKSEIIKKDVKVLDRIKEESNTLYRVVFNRDKIPISARVCKLLRPHSDSWGAYGKVAFVFARNSKEAKEIGLDIVQNKLFLNKIYYKK